MFAPRFRTCASQQSSVLFKKDTIKTGSAPVTKLVLRWANDFDRYLDDLGISYITWQQQELIDAYKRGCSNIAVRAGKGPGKTFITAVIASHWLITHPFGKLIVTAPTFRQCKDVWMAQVEKIVRSDKAHPVFKKIFRFQGKGFSVLDYKMNIWGCQLITARKSEAFQGIHDKYLFILEEESSGVPSDISQAAFDTITNAKGNYIYLKIGNPNKRDSAFFNSFYRDVNNIWEKLRWNAEETPESEFFSKRRNEELAEEFGTDSDVYRIAVLGEFPEKDSNALIDEKLLLEACGKNAFERALAVKDFTKQIGIDLARNGDRNAIVIRCGNIIKYRWSGKVEPIEALDKAIMKQQEFGWSDEETIYVIDTAGMGEGLAYLMSHASQRNKKVHEFYTQNVAYNSHKYSNKMTEAWCEFNKSLRKRELYLGEKIDNRTLVQLISRLFTVTDKGKVEIESKKLYKKRMADVETGEIGKSPDEADALMMAFYPYASTSSGLAIG